MYLFCIHRNYVKLRDIGQAVDFGVTYDAKTNTVTICPDQPYEMEVTAPASTTPTSQTFPSALSHQRGRFHQRPPGRQQVRSPGGRRDSL